MKIPKESFWKKSFKATIPSFPALSGLGPKVDVCVVGSGIFGLQTALRLQEHGKQVAVIEGGKVCNGVTCHTTGKVTSLHNICYSKIESKFDRNVSKLYAQMNEAGLNEIKKNISKYNIECDWEDTNCYSIAMDGRSIHTISEEVEAAQHAGLNATYVTHISELPLSIKAAIRVENQGQFNAFAYCMGLTNQLQKGGAFIYENSRVHDVSITAPHTVQTNEGSLEAQHVIVATHLPILDRSGHFGVVEPNSSYCVAFTLEGEKEHPPRGMYITVDPTDEYGIKSIRYANNGKVLIVAGDGHKTGEIKPTGNSENNYENLVKFAREHFPVQDVICGWSALDYTSADFLPYIGRLHHGTATVWTATGFKKWGLSTAAASSMVISDLICGVKNEDTTLWAETFDATRWDLTKSTLNMLKYQGNVAKHFVGTRIAEAFTAIDIEDLVNDQGGICQRGLEVVAAYKDEKGGMHVFSPACTHLGCRLSYNEGDKSFDCSCHGSRFDAKDGSVLHGPAVKPLASIPDEFTPRL